MILPRQARDKHRENSNKDGVFRTMWLSSVGSGLPALCSIAAALESGVCKETHHLSLSWVASLCLSRACLGKMLISSIKWHRKRLKVRFLTCSTM